MVSLAETYAKIQSEQTTAQQAALLLQQDATKLGQQKAQLETEGKAIESKYSANIRNGTFIGSREAELAKKQQELEQAKTTLATIQRLKGNTASIEAIAKGKQSEAMTVTDEYIKAAQSEYDMYSMDIAAFNARQADLASRIAEYNRSIGVQTSLEDKLKADIVTYNANVDVYNKQAKADYEAQVAKQAKADYDLAVSKQAEFSSYLRKVVEGKDLPQTIDIRTWTNTRRGEPYYAFQAIPDIKLPSQSGYTSGESQDITTKEAAEQWAIGGAKSYYGLGSEDIIRVNGRIVQESSFTPEQIKIASDVFSGRQSVLTQYDKTRYEERSRLADLSEFLKQDIVKTQELYNQTAGKTPTEAYNILKVGLIGSLGKETLEGTQFKVGDVIFSKPDIAERYQTQLNEIPQSQLEQIKLKSEWKGVFTPESAALAFAPVGTNVSNLLPWKMPTDINPTTGKGYATPDLEFQAHAPFIKQSEWYNQLSTPEKVLAIGGSMNFGIWSEAIQNKYGDSISQTESRYIPRISKFASFIEGFDPMSGFNLESASIGAGDNKQTISYTKLPEPTHADVLASRLYNYYDIGKPTKPLLERFGTGLYKGVTSDATIAIASAYGVGLVAGGIGKGITITAGARAANIAMKGVGYTITGVVGTDVALKALSGDIGGSVVEGGVFAATLPYATAGYRLAVGIKAPDISGLSLSERIAYIAKGKSIEIPEGLYPEKAIKFESGAKLAIELGKMEAPITKPLDFTKIKALGDFGKDVETWIRENPQQNPIIGGSAAARAQFRGARLAGDIDIDVLNPKEAALSLYPKAQSFFGKENVGLDINERFNQATIEIYGKHGIQFIEKVPDIVIGQHTGLEEFGISRKPITIEGIQYKPANELLLRKADSILRQQGKTINPQPHRMKDITDFESMANEFLATKKAEADKSWWLLKSIRSGKVESLRTELETYKMYSGIDVYPYAVRAARYAMNRPYGLIGAGISALTIPERYKTTPAQSIRDYYNSNRPILNEYYPTGLSALRKTNYPANYPKERYTLSDIINYHPINYHPSGYRPSPTPKYRANYSNKPYTPDLYKSSPIYPAKQAKPYPYPNLSQLTPTSKTIRIQKGEDRLKDITLPTKKEPFKERHRHKVMIRDWKVRNPIPGLKEVLIR